MIDKAELKRAYDWALETGFFDEENFMEIADTQWGGLLDIFCNKTKPKRDVYNLQEIINEKGEKLFVVSADRAYGAYLSYDRFGRRDGQLFLWLRRRFQVCASFL